MVWMTRSEWSTTHFWARRRILPRPSKPSASHAGCAARAARASSATCSAGMSGTWAMTSPVAGFSTAMSPAAVAVPLVAGCSSTVATALAPASFDGVSNPTAGSGGARRTDDAGALAGEGHGLDADRLDRAVAAVGLRRADALDHVLTAGDLAEDRVLAVQPRALVSGDDEELRPVGVRSCVGHGKRAADDLVIVDLVLELIARTARAGALGAAALDHEVGDDAVEDQPVVEALAGELLEVADCLRGVLVEQLEGDLAFAGLHHGLGHGDSSGSSGTGRWARALSRAARARRCAGAVRRWAAG